MTIYEWFALNDNLLLRNGRRSRRCRHTHMICDAHDTRGSQVDLARCLGISHDSGWTLWTKLATMIRSRFATPKFTSPVLYSLYLGYLVCRIGRNLSLVRRRSFSSTASCWCDDNIKRAKYEAPIVKLRVDKRQYTIRDVREMHPEINATNFFLSITFLTHTLNARFVNDDLHDRLFGRRHCRGCSDITQYCLHSFFPIPVLCDITINGSRPFQTRHRYYCQYFPVKISILLILILFRC